MSLRYADETWVPQNTTEHADAIIDKINTALQENNVQDAVGHILQLKKNYGNALYLLALGNGERFAENDEKLSAAINSFNIELCDDAQIENLLPIAALSRNPGSYSTLNLTCTAGDGVCTIPAGTRAKFGDYYFETLTEAVISAGATQVVATQCTTLGPVVVLSGEVDSFEVQIANLDSVSNLESSVPGVAAETINEVRAKLIAGDTIKYSLNGCKAALEELTGVTYARVYFNYNTDESMELAGGVEIEPRTAYIVIHGSSDKIAEVYATYMSAPTQNAPDAAGTYSYVDVTITAGSEGAAVIPSGTTATYLGHVFVTTGGTVAMGTSSIMRFTCNEVGPFAVPILGINELDTEIANVESAQNLTAGIPGTYNPAKVQNWVTSSGQSIPIYYDTASEQNVFVRVWLKEDADYGTQVENQIKRDLILASSDWRIGESVTQLLTCEPFVNCTYTTVSYTEISTDGETWEKVVDMGCNVIPRVSDATIIVEQLGE